MERYTQIVNIRRLRIFKIVVKADKNKTFQLMEVVGNAIFHEHTYINTLSAPRLKIPPNGKFPQCGKGVSYHMGC